MTLEEWAALDDDIEGELVDGMLEEEEMPSVLHGIAVAWLLAALHGWARPRVVSSSAPKRRSPLAYVAAASRI